MEALKLYEGYLLDEETVSEIDGAFATAREMDGSELDAVWAAPEQWVPSDEDEATVDRYLRALRYYRAEAASVKAAAKAERERVDAWEDRMLRGGTGAISYLEHRLKQFSEAVGRTKRVSPAGTLSWRKGSHKVVIEDEEQWAKDHKDGDLAEFVRPKFEPRKKEIGDYIKATGDIPEGVEWVRGPDTFKITTEGS